MNISDLARFSRIAFALGAVGLGCTQLVGTFSAAEGSGASTTTTSTATTTTSGTTTSDASAPECKEDVDCAKKSTTCLPNICVNGACLGNPAANGAACNEGGGQYCDGKGSCLQCLSSADCPASKTSCVIATCSPAGACGTQNAPDRTGCSDSGGKICQSGKCLSCINDGDCGAGNVCQASQCIGQCQDSAIDGNETDTDCGGGSCPSCPVGKTCKKDNDCVTSAACLNSVCTQCAAKYGQNCGKCNGVVNCDGSCSVATPSNLGDACGQCGGIIRCDGSCSVTTPINYGKPCKTGIQCPCGGTLAGLIDCNGTCVPQDDCGPCCISLPCDPR